MINVLNYNLNMNVINSDDDTGKMSEGDLSDLFSDEKNDNNGQNVNVKKRVIIRNSRPKLDSDRLCGPKGLNDLLYQFQNFSLKGKGHEKEDLENLLKILEHWGHRLFPKLEFKDLLHRIEILGSKREVQAALHRLRVNKGDDIQMDETEEIEIVE